MTQAQPASTKRRVFIVCAIVLLGIVAGSVWLGISKDPSTATASRDERQRPVPVAEPIKRPSVALAGYATWTVVQQRKALADLERAPDLDPETVRFLLAIIRDRGEAANARNLAANALTVRGRRVAGLSETFLKQAEDALEDPLWRDYALQHAAAVAMTGSDVDAVVTVLTRTATEGGPSSGTALLMLQRIEQTGNAQIDLHLLDAVAQRVFASPSSDMNTTISMLGVMGERGNRQHLPAMRQLLSSEEPAIRRAACGALGLLGESVDAERIGQMTEDTDASVAAAAAIAVHRIRARERQ